MTRINVARPTLLLLLISMTAFVLFGQDGTTGTGDVDRDGIPDQWEVNGVGLTYPDGSTHFLDLKAQKASPGHKDIIVWVDWMGNETLIDHGKSQVHNHKPLDSAIAIVKNAFAGAKQFTDNPDGTTGINLIVLVSPTPVPHTDMLGSGNIDDGSLWTKFDTIRDGRLPAQLKGIAHYCLFAHDIASDGTSGISYDIGAYDFIVSLGEWQDHVGNESEQAGTFMHELGHNLGLRHGGADDLNYKPNYLSVMNYFFQTDGLATPTGDNSINYSVFAFSDLNEKNLDETQPMTTDATWANWGSSYFCPSDKANSRIISSIFGAPVDWNCDGQHTVGVMADPNGDDNIVSNAQNTLKSQQDWNAIKFIYPAPALGVTPGLRPNSELTVSGANKIPLPPVTGLSYLAQGSSVRLSWNKVASSRVRGYEITRTATDAPKLVFVTSDLSFVDTLAKPVSQVRYGVETLFVPHGASGSVKITGQKLNGLDLLGIVNTNTTFAAKLADPIAVGQLKRNLASATRTLRATGGLTPNAITGLANQVQDLGNLLTSQAATIDVKLN